MRSVIVLLAFFALTGCATQAQRAEAFRQNLDPFVGRNADEIIVARGPPTNAYTLSTGGKVLEYAKSTIFNSGGGSTTIWTPVFIPHPAGGAGTWTHIPTQQPLPFQSYEQTCRILFQISARNVVESWKSEGNACY